MRRMVSCCCCLLSLAATSFAEPLVHGPEYQPGQTIRGEVETEVRQTLVIAGMNVETQANNFMVVLETVEDAGDDGAVLKGRFETFQINLNLPGGQQFQFDQAGTAKEGDGGPLAELSRFLKAMSRSPWRSKLDRQGRMTSMEWLDIAPADVPEMFRGELASERFLQANNMLIDRLPGREVAVGESWSRKEESPLGNGQYFTMSRKFTYRGKTDRNGRALDLVTFQTESIQYNIADGSSIPLKAKESQLTVASSDGQFWYDPRTRRIVEVDDKMQVTGTLTFLAGDQEVPATLDLTMRVHNTVK